MPSPMISTTAPGAALALFALALAAAPGRATASWTVKECTAYVERNPFPSTASHITWEGVKVPIKSGRIYRELVAPPTQVGLSLDGNAYPNVCRYNYNWHRGNPLHPYKVCANQMRDYSLFNSRSETSMQFTCQNGFMSHFEWCLTGGCTADMQQSGIGTAACTEDEFTYKYDKNGDLVGKTRVPDWFRTKIADSDYISCEHHVHTGRTCHPLLSPVRHAPKLEMDLGVSYRCKGTAAEPLDVESCWKGCDPNTGLCKERDVVVDICKGIRCGRMCVDRWPQLNKVHKIVDKWVEQSVSVLCVNEKIATKTVCRNKCQGQGHGRASKCT